MCKVCSSLGEKWGNERAITGSKIILTCPFLMVTESIHTIVNCWKQRGLTLGGRIQVFKSLIFSKLVYASSVQYISGDVVKEICKILKDFIWRGKRPKIKHSTLIGNFENGGLKDIDIESKLKALKLSWIKRLSDSNFHQWKTLAAKLLEPVGGTKIFHSNLSFFFEFEFLFFEFEFFFI